MQNTSRRITLKAVRRPSASCGTIRQFSQGTVAQSGAAERWETNAPSVCVQHLSCTFDIEPSSLPFNRASPLGSTGYRATSHSVLPFRLRCLMAKEDRELEMARLRHELKKAQEDEVFGGLTALERAEYNRNLRRINELEIEEGSSAVEEKKKRRA